MTSMNFHAHRRLVFRVGLWLALYAASILMYNASYRFTRDVLIYQTQVRPAAWLLQATLPGQKIWYQESKIYAPGLELEILRGCDGVEAWLLIVTAFVVFPMTWIQRLRCMALGTILIFSLNLMRIVSIFHIVLRRPEWFDLVHGLIWQSVIVLSAVVFILIEFESAGTIKTGGRTSA